MTNFENEYLGPFIYNSTIVCLNTSRLISYNYANFSPSSSLLGKKIVPNPNNLININKKYLTFQVNIMMISSSVLKTWRMTLDINNMWSAFGTCHSVS